VPQVLEHAAAQHKDRGLVVHADLVEVQVGRELAAGALDVRVPARLEVVTDEV
jgi:hypothetical protein